ncbi:MAG: hypothetical protein ACLT8O_06900 [Blautia massiliensis (ex Durand et al. 2017)]
MIGVLGGLSLIVGLFSLIDTSTSTSFSVTYLVIGIVLLIIYFAKEIIPETNFGRKKLMKLSFQTNTTEIGYNRRELEEELKKFITDKEIFGIYILIFTMEFQHIVPYGLKMIGIIITILSIEIMDMIM